MGKNTGFVSKKEVEKEFVFDPLTAKVGEDAYTLTWEKEIGRFDLRRNGGLIFSDIGLHICVNMAREKGVVFQIHEKIQEKKGTLHD